MKHFKKWFLGVLYTFMVLIGSLIIVNFGFRKQSPGIPDVNAQTKELNFPGDTFLLPHGSPNPYGVGAVFSSHPSDTFYIPWHSSFPGYPDNEYYMPGVRTISTASTCAWDCGQTYTTCGQRQLPQPVVAAYSVVVTFLHLQPAVASISAVQKLLF